VMYACLDSCIHSRNHHVLHGTHLELVLTPWHALRSRIVEYWLYTHTNTKSIVFTHTQTDKQLGGLPHPCCGAEMYLF
jgi:hypothetical protein